MIKIRLFGTLTVEQDGQSMPLPASAQARDLLAYLTLFRERKHTRSLLAGIFWPDQSEERARRALSQAVWHIRRSFPDLITARGETIGISAQMPIWVDTQAFQEAAQPWLSFIPLPPPGRAALVEVIVLYCNDLLEGNYADWALMERERLRAQYQQALEQLSQAEKSAGNFTQALEYGLRLLQADPLRESAHREVMRLQHLLGHPEAALRQFETCRRLLKDELDLEPEAETLSLAQEILRRSSEQTTTFLPEKPPDERQKPLFSVALVGRQQERAILLAHLEAALNGTGGVALIEGEAGIGKTRLLEEIARDAEWRGAQVLWGNIQSPDVVRPFGIMVDAIEAGLSPLRIEQICHLVEQIWLQSLCSLIPAFSTQLSDLKPAVPLASKQERARLAEAFAQLLRAWRQILPVVLLLEDLHWADQDTLDLLPELASHIKAAGILLVCSYRNEEAHSTPALWESIQRLDQTGQRLHLNQLNAQASGELIRCSLALRQSAPLFESRIHATTEGNPLYILETLRTLCDERLLHKDEKGNWHTPWDESTHDYAEMPLPPGVERVIGQRLRQLPSEAQEILHLTATLGRQVDFQMLATVSGLHPPVLLERVRHLIQRYWLEEAGQGYRFNHDMVRQVIYQSLDMAKCQSMHQQAGEAIERAFPTQVDALAHHFEKAAIWDKAVTYHLQAAGEAHRLQAFQQASKHYSQILSILEEHTPYGKDKTSQERALQVRFEALCMRQRLSWMAGLVESEQHDLDAMIMLADQLNDPQRQIIAKNRKALFLTDTLDDYAGGRAAAETALELSRQHGDRHGEAAALDILGRVAYATDCYDEAVKHFTAALSTWQVVGETSEISQVHIRLGRVYKIMGNLEDAQDQYNAGLESARENGNLVDEMYANTNLAILARVQGDYPSAIQYNQRALRVACEIGHRPNQATALDNLGVAYWSLRDYGHALKSMQESLQLVRSMNDRRGMIFCLNNLGDLSREIGAYEQADQYLTEGLAITREIGFPSAESNFLLGLGRLRIEEGNLDKALGYFEQSLAISQGCKNLALAGSALCGLGLVQMHRTRFQAAVNYFTQALEAHTEAGEVDYATIDRSYLAFCLSKSGDITQAASLNLQAVSEVESHPGGEEVQQIYYNHWLVLQTTGETQAARQALYKAFQYLQAQVDSLDDPALRTAHLENVLINRQIRAARESMLVHRITARIPRLGCPTEAVEVTWTVATPEDDEIADKVARRRYRLRRLLSEAREQGAEPSYKHLAEALQVGLRTVERDMAKTSAEAEKSSQL